MTAPVAAPPDQANIYLTQVKQKYDSLRSAIQGLQDKAVRETRDLSVEEMTSVKEMTEQSKGLYTQIEHLTDVAVRDAKVRLMQANVDLALHDASRAAGNGRGADAAGQGEAVGDPHTRGTNVGGTTTQDRDPGHYRSVTKGGTHSFFRDIYRAKEGDGEAVNRLAEHTRALTTGVAGLGVVPPKWLLEEYAPLARQGRSLADAVRNIPLGDDPRPMTLPKQTTGADSSNPAQQAAEGDPTPNADKWASSTDLVVPKPTRGLQKVTRQMLDMASPAVDLLIFGDLIAEYNRQVESAVGVALITASGAAVATFATEAAFNGTPPAVPALDAVIDAAIAVWDARKLPADVLAMSIGRWGKFKKRRDSTGRSLIPSETAGPVNVSGVGTVQAAGVIEGLAVVVTDSTNISTSLYPDNFMALRGSDTILFEGNLMQFRYEERSGPEFIELGLWRYTAIVVRYPGQSSKRVQITAA